MIEYMVFAVVVYLALELSKVTDTDSDQEET